MALAVGRGRGHGRAHGRGHGVFTVGASREPGREGRRRGGGVSPRRTGRGGEGAGGRRRVLPHSKDGVTGQLRSDEN